MLPAPGPSQSDASGTGEMDEFEEAPKFISWAAKGVADLILPEIKENSDEDV